MSNDLDGEDVLVVVVTEQNSEPQAFLWRQPQLLHGIHAF